MAEELTRPADPEDASSRDAAAADERTGSDPAAGDATDAASSAESAEREEYVPGSRRSDVPRRQGWRTREERPYRQPWIWPRLTMASAIVLVFMLLALWPLVQGRLEASEKLKQAEAMLVPARATVSRIDNVVRTQLSAEAEPNVPNVVAEILVAHRELSAAIKLIDAAMPRLTDEETRRAKVLRASADARLAMLDAAPAILIASVDAVQAKALADRAWRMDAVAAHSEVNATRNYEAGVASKVESASVSMNVAARQLADARSFYSQAASAFPEAGFERYVSYTDQHRTQVVRLGTAATRWLAGQKAVAAYYFAAYKAQRAKLASAFAALPGAPGKATGIAFRRIAGARADAYERARLKAQEADKALAREG